MSYEDEYFPIEEERDPSEQYEDLMLAESEAARFDVQAAERQMGDMIADAEAEYGDEYELADLVEALRPDYDVSVVREMQRRHLGWADGDE